MAKTDAKDSKGKGAKPAAKAAGKPAGKPGAAEKGAGKSKDKGAFGGLEFEDKPAAASSYEPNRMRLRYKDEIVTKLMERFSYKNVMQVPRLEKVVLNMGISEAVANPKALDAAVADMLTIAGQRPLVTKARKSIAAFKLRAGVSIGAKVTLRGDRMYVFLDKLFNVVLPRIRDFRGLNSRSFDGRGNYAFGLKEQIIFPEIDYDKVDKVRGMDIIIVTTARTDEEAREFLRMLGCPLREAEAGVAAPKKRRKPAPGGKAKAKAKK
jgi:large subunit ribosomal protein L5